MAGHSDAMVATHCPAALAAERPVVITSALCPECAHPQRQPGLFRYPYPPMARLACHLKVGTREGTQPHAYPLCVSPLPPPAAPGKYQDNHHPFQLPLCPPSAPNTQCALIPTICQANAGGAAAGVLFAAAGGAAGAVAIPAAGLFVGEAGAAAVGGGALSGYAGAPTPMARLAQHLKVGTREAGADLGQYRSGAPGRRR